MIQQSLTSRENSESISSTPSFSRFEPVIPYQARVINDVYFNFDYSLGIHEILLSGSVGSAKSILMAHLGVRHCVENRRARFLMGRMALPDLKETIFLKIIEHLEGSFIEGKHYFVNMSRAEISFCNGSKLIPRTWADGRFTKVRSLDLSGALVEELTENKEKQKQAYFEIKMRVGRLPHIRRCLLITATNPDSPSHWAYQYFELPVPHTPTKHVYYSVTTDNPFLPPQYIAQLKRDLDPKLARRMIYGEWIDLNSDVVYYAYDHSVNHRKETYRVREDQPIFINFDFNIGEGKPLSCCLFQYVDGCFHVFNEVVVEGMRTESACEELAERGLLDHRVRYFIHGDATGRHADTRNIKSDYDIIKGFLSNYVTPDGAKLDFIIEVPLANPSIRLRHNTVNGHCKNSLGEVRLFTYKEAPTVDLGLRLTKLREGGDYVEDDSKACPYQHVTTALGYGMVYEINKARRGVSSSRQL